jgi:polysaccharide biosynthesis transport protein
MGTKPKRPAPRTLPVVLGRAWALILGVAIVFGLATLAVSWLQKPVYAASTTLYLTSGGTVASSAYDSVTSSTERVGSYAQLIYSQAVIMPAAQAVGLDVTLDEARKRVSVDFNPQVVLMTLTVEDQNPKVAQQFADALAQSMQAAVSKLEVPGAASEPLVKIRQVTNANLDPSPVKPTTLLNVSIAVAIGLIVGCLIALLRESRNTRVRDENDAEVALDADVLAVVRGADDAQEQYRALRTRLMAQASRAHTILITSAHPTESTATVAMQLGRNIARSANSVVLVDAGLANPRISKWVGSKGEPGVVDVLRGAPLGPAIKHNVDGIRSLAVLGAGSRTSAHPADMLSSPGFEKLLNALASQFDVVLVDSTALLDDSGAESILPSVDGVLMTAGPTLSSMADLVACRARFDNAQARVLGLVYFESWEEPASPTRTNRRRQITAEELAAMAPSANHSAPTESREETAGVNR